MMIYMTSCHFLCMNFFYVISYVVSNAKPHNCIYTMKFKKKKNKKESCFQLYSFKHKNECKRKYVNVLQNMYKLTF